MLYSDVVLSRVVKVGDQLLMGGQVGIVVIFARFRLRSSPNQ